MYNSETLSVYLCQLSVKKDSGRVSRFDILQIILFFVKRNHFVSINRFITSKDREKIYNEKNREFVEQFDFTSNRINY